jgi:hypothetical protein
MNKFAIPLVAVAFLTAACGGSTSTAAQRASTGSLGSVQAQPGANAGSDVSDLGRVNPAVRKANPVASVPAQPQQGTASSAPALPPGQDRCSTGSGTTGGSGLRASGGKHLPQPMCLVE